MSAERNRVMCDAEGEMGEWDKYKLWDRQVRPIATRVRWFAVVMVVVGAAVFAYLTAQAPSTIGRMAATAPGVD